MTAHALDAALSCPACHREWTIEHTIDSATSRRLGDHIAKLWCGGCGRQSPKILRLRFCSTSAISARAAMLAEPADDPEGEG